MHLCAVMVTDFFVNQKVVLDRSTIERGNDIPAQYTIHPKTTAKD